MSETLTGWIVQLTCCGRDNGTFGAATWEEADQFREDYLASTHDRSAIIVAGYEAADTGRTAP
jgi:hypothetical protein